MFLEEQKKKDFFWWQNSSRSNLHELFLWNSLHNDSEIIVLARKSKHHPFHLVDPSPWPIIAAIGGLALTFGGSMYMHNYFYGFELLILGIAIILFIMFTWWRDVVREGTYEGLHTKEVQFGLRYGMVLFIISEGMFFFAFFWAFFHSSLSPSFDVGGTFPPIGVEVLNPWAIPLLNTIVLLSSGVTITLAHHAIIAGSRKKSLLGLSLTIILAIFFTALQGFEYCNALFSISDTVYGAVFYITTGFHGFHVLIGTCFLIVCIVRLFYHHFTQKQHFGFEAAAMYWHFVDGIWLFVFVVIYWWGS